MVRKALPQHTFLCAHGLVEEFKPVRQKLLFPLPSRPWTRAMSEAVDPDYQKHPLAPELVVSSRLSMKNCLHAATKQLFRLWLLLDNALSREIKATSQVSDAPKAIEAYLAVFGGKEMCRYLADDKKRVCFCSVSMVFS